MSNLLRTPSVKTLAWVFDNPKEAKRILRMSRKELCEHPVGAARVAECSHAPATYDIRMHVLNSIDEGLHGTESVKIGDYFADYLNTGEMYAATLIYWCGNYRVQSLGDFVETLERNGIKVD
jgi:hypothetical protein